MSSGAKRRRHPAAAHYLGLLIAGLLCLTTLPPVAVAAEDLTVGGTATVAYANGDDVMLRAAPGPDGAVLLAVPEGTAVEVLDGPIPAADGSAWYAVRVWGTDGFITAAYLAPGDSAPSGAVGTDGLPSEEPSPVAPEAAALEPVPGGTATVVADPTTLDGSALLREAPGFEAASLLPLLPGTVVDVVEGPLYDADGSGWFGVRFGEQTGYLPAASLVGNPTTDTTGPIEPTAEWAPTEAPPTEVPPTEVPPTDVPSTDPAPVEVPITGSAVVVGTNGNGAYCRTGPGVDAAPIVVLAEGETVALTGEPSGDWQPVLCAGSLGFVLAAFLNTGGWEEPSGADQPAPTEVPTDIPTVQPDPTQESIPTEELIPTEVATEEPAPTQMPAEEAPAEEVPTSEPTVEVPTETEIPTEEPTEEPTVEPTVVEPTSTEAPTDVATETPTEPAETATPTADLSTAEEPTPSRVAASPTAMSRVMATATPKATATATGTPVTATSSGYATVVRTSGGYLRCRTAPLADASMIVGLPEGTRLALRGDVVEGVWQPVECAGREGYVHKAYLAYGATGDATGGLSIQALNGQTSGYATVTGTNGGGLNCRSAASYTASVITVMAEGTRVSLRGAAVGVWQPITCASRSGYAHKDYLTASTSGGTSGGSTSGSTYATVTGTGGDGVRCRSQASWSASTITVIPEGTRVTVRGSLVDVWRPVVCAGRNGYVHKDYLTISTSSGGGGTGSTWVPRLSTGDHARVKAPIELRYAASGSGGVAAMVPAGTVVEVTGWPSGGYYPVNWDGLRGFIYNRYLSETTAALTQRGGSGDSGGGSDGGGSGSTGGSATGQAIVNYAMRYLGYPYVWATHGPASFDCSGFTNWVIKNTLGIQIWYSEQTQINYGTPVSFANLQPGDLVFFQNTYRWGLSHVGIYIGNGQFIHAENETSGVNIDSLSSTYYASRWYGARRLA